MMPEEVGIIKTESVISALIIDFVLVTSTEIFISIFWSTKESYVLVGNEKADNKTCCTA